MWRTQEEGVGGETNRPEARRRRGDDRVRAHRPHLPASSWRACSASAAFSSTGSRRTTWRARPRAGPSSIGIPYTGQTLQQHAARSSTVEFDNDVRVCIDFPGKTQTTVDLGDPVRVRIQKPFSFVPIMGIGTITIRGSSTMRIERMANNVDPTAYTEAELRREGLHMRRARDERGAVLVMAAVMIPVFLLLTALVVDVGNWFTHDRQLQNRADAAAFAAGIGYAQNWKACVQNGRPAR